MNVYSFLVLCIEFHVARTQTAFAKVSHATEKVKQACSVAYARNYKSLSYCSRAK